MSDRVIRLLLVDDHPAAREPLAMLLDRQQDLTVAGQAESLSQARQLLAEGLIIDVAVVDLDLPDGHGSELIHDLRRALPEAAVMVLTSSKDRWDLARAVEAGAAHVVHKSASMAQLMTAVRDVYAGKLLFDPREATELLELVSERRARDDRDRAALARLTQREREVLQLMAQGLDNQAIADRLYVGVETVRTHVARLLRKLGVDSRLQAILLAYRSGIARLE